ncbi:MAG: molecular chaperone HtpG [Clostridium sp.]|nr:molecular chaperone HtpG [Clostridium sp.]
MAMKQFKAESKRLLDLMIHSIYTHQEIFLRELISNASDAIDKLYYKSLQDGDTGLNRDDFCITIDIDKDNRNLIITDNGCGMTKEDLENNLGVIAKSGSLNFKQTQEKRDEIDIIGQFGVGFYSAFMVSDCVTVHTRTYGSDEAYEWKSKGVEGYSITPCEKESHGTQIILHIKPNTDEENYDEYLDSFRIQSIVKKYSDYIRYPIQMDVEKPRLKEGSGEKPEFETVVEKTTLNSMVPIWRKRKSEVTDEEYESFYQEKFYDFEKPLRIIHSNTEGVSTYSALLFIPSKAPSDYYTRQYETGLQLYASGVMIMERCEDLLPEYFGFVRGLVDSQDLSLNISREMLQHDRQLQLIESRLEKKIKSELESMMNNDRETYETFFQNFGLQLKFGAYADYGAHKEVLQDLLMFYSSSEQKLVTLKEYVSRMKEGQESIYYACGDNLTRIETMPQIELLKDKGLEVLYLTDDVDEFVLKTIASYENKSFKNISSDDLNLESEEEKKSNEAQIEQNRDLLDFMKESLSDKVAKVVLSQRLKSHPVCLSTEGEITLEMEKVLNAMPSGGNVKAIRVLEINANHPIFHTLQSLFEHDKDKLKSYTNLLYGQALLMEGMPIEDPVTFSNQICDLMNQ